MTFGEFWEGIVVAGQRDDSTRLLEEFLQAFTIHWPDRETMQKYGELRVYLRERGQLVNVPDIIIAATALRHGLILVTRNLRHFNRIPDLQVLPSADLE